MNKCGKLVVFVPQGTGMLDSNIISYIANEVKSVVSDGMCDLSEYGTGDLYDVEVTITFKRKDGCENGR